MIDWASEQSIAGRAGQARFDRLAITSVFGDPLDLRTWSGAPARLAMALRRRGIGVVGIHSGGTRGEHILLGAQQSAMGFGVPAATEAILRGRMARQGAAARIASIIRQQGVRHVLHMGTLDLPAIDGASDVKHYVYCDHAWALSLRHRPDIDSYSPRAVRWFDELEREALSGLAHVFTFGRYVRDHLIEHYGLAPERVTAVGCGMGPIHPYYGGKDYAGGKLLFVAKHLFQAKGGELVLEAVEIARRTRPDLTLTIVGNPRVRRQIPRDPAITFHGHLPFEDLQGLYRDAALLVQPMLNDPWGQVYVEAMISRTPVLGLVRNGLPEIIEHGRHGFMVDRAEPRALAAAIIDAVGDPDRLARMGDSGLRHVLASYSWDRVAERIAFPPAQPANDDLAGRLAVPDPLPVAMPLSGAGPRQPTQAP